MEDIAERLISRVKGRRLSLEEYKNEIMIALREAGDAREQSKIKFDYRMRRRRLLSDKMEVERIIRGLMSAVDDFVVAQAKFFKDIENKYKYHYPHIQ